MNILLTGGTGYIGSHAAVVLASAGHQIALFDNLSNSDKSVLDRLEKITHQKMVFAEGDVRDTVLLSKVLSQNKIDAVMHFAGLKAVDESMKDPIKYYENNVTGSISLIKAMQLNNIKTLVFSSSATIYGKPQYLPYDEDHPKNPINTYGRTKLYVEEILHDLASTNDEWSIAVLRYFNPVGAHASGLIGEKPQGIPNNLMPYLCQVASGKLEKLKIFGNDYDTCDGSGERDYIHIIDLAEGHLAALDFLRLHRGWRAFNLGTGQSISVLQLIQTFEKINHIKIPYEIVNRRPGDLPASFSNSDFANKTLGWQAKYSIDAMCESSWHWELNSNNKS